MDLEGGLFFLHSTFKRRLIISWNRRKIFKSNPKVHEGECEKMEEQAKNRRSHWDKYSRSPCYYVDHEEKYEEPMHCFISKFLLLWLEWLHSTYFGSKANKNIYFFFSFWCLKMSLFGTNSYRKQTGLDRLSQEIGWFWQSVGFAIPVAYKFMCIMINCWLFVVSFTMGTFEPLITFLFHSLSFSSTNYSHKLYLVFLSYLIHCSFYPLTNDCWITQ